MNDWGELVLQKIVDSDDFWLLYDELIDDKSNFIYNRAFILSAFKHGHMYGMRVNETQEMFYNQTRNDTIFCSQSLSNYLLPCFCIKNDDNAIIIWTHSRARNRGIARKLVQLLNIKNAFNPLPSSIGFWQKCNIVL